MEVTKPYEFIGFGAMEVTKPYEFIGFGAMEVHPGPQYTRDPGISESRYTSRRGRSTLCYAIVLPARKSALRAGFCPDCYRESTEIGPPAGPRPAGGQILVFSR
jgi:hypothetical protein